MGVGLQVQPLVFEQLARLTQLQKLYVTWNPKPNLEDDEPVFQGSVDLRLDYGLGKLSSLRMLREISFVDTVQQMGEQEIDWILEHWKCVEEIYGELDSWNPDKDKALKERLALNGVS
ncbi:hypothetical protein BGZ65_007874 [Modicella reniformis]|uniref:Uncharacterized protein n=1 Tax=Modicella reniformis TaxID=1440133 RepID=A0A9P6MB24_9FUNG|nr:hypothetical protein BGZ65_007874 [Modicella reniformis]